jgi:hypothetical protein
MCYRFALRKWGRFIQYLARLFASDCLLSIDDTKLSFWYVLSGRISAARICSQSIDFQWYPLLRYKQTCDERISSCLGKRHSSTIGFICEIDHFPFQKGERPSRNALAPSWASSLSSICMNSGHFFDRSAE